MRSTDDANSPSEKHKLIELESLRGIAAFSVLIHHSLLAFFPRFHGLLEPDSPYTLFGNPLFAMVNGSAAVILFFTLSGFVLTLKSFQHPSYPALVLSALKRWPRLMVPVVIVNVASGILAGWGYYGNASVAAHVPSTWLGWFFVESPQGISAVKAAAYEGTVSTFLFGSAYYNSSLWTMKYEFFGSFLCLSTAFVMLLSKRHAPWSFLLVAILLLGLNKPLYWPFLVGVGLAAFYASRWWHVVPTWVSTQGWPFWVLVTASLFLLFGYHEALAPTQNPLGFYAILTPFYEFSAEKTRVAMHSLASVILIILTLSTPVLRDALRGNWGVWLGKMSFPIYLVQVSVICSLACYVYTASLFLGDFAASTLALIAAVLGSVAAATPLMKIEGMWLNFLRRFSAR